MSSDARIRANRLNAQKSTGPKTPEGKARCAANSLKHGLCAKFFVTKFEDAAAFEDLRNDLVEQYAPANPTEEYLVDELAQCMWRKQRARGHEKCMLDEVDPESGRGFSMHAFALHLRYETNIERSFYRTLEKLERLIQLRQSRPLPVRAAASAVSPAPAPTEVAQTATLNLVGSASQKELAAAKPAPPDHPAAGPSAFPRQPEAPLQPEFAKIEDRP